MHELFISKDLYDEHASKYGVPKVGDIMITAIGTIGNSYIVTNKDKFYFKDASILWLDKKSDVDSKFINYWIKSEGFSKQLDEGHGATVDTLTVKKLQSILSPVPPLPEQKQISSILSNVDDTLQKTNQIIEQTQRLKKGMMQKLLTRGIGHTKFKKTKIGEIPEEWEIVKLDSICNKITDGTHHSPINTDVGDFLYITAKNIKTHGIDLTNVTYVSEKIHSEIYSRCNPEKNDVLYFWEVYVEK